MILLMSEDHCDDRVGTKILRRQKGAREKVYSTRKGLTCFKGQKREGERAAQMDREEPRGLREGEGEGCG